jgi:hypothetical protein
LFLNWACSAENLNIDPREFTLIVPCDEASQNLAKKMKFKYVDDEWLKKMHHVIR